MFYPSSSSSVFLSFCLLGFLSYGRQTFDIRQQNMQIVLPVCYYNKSLPKQFWNRFFICNSLLLVEIKRLFVVQYISGSTFLQCLFSFPFCKDELFWIWLTKYKTPKKSKLWNVVNIVKCLENCDVWSKLWNVVNIVKFCWNLAQAG